ncbi:HTH_Tnp_Tc3_2 domain-containing protein [Trichonephila clavipes]|nr:HTH_Tnp_Tc3_2 domain-containing protein [Trichonephila clavipes]
MEAIHVKYANAHTCHNNNFFKDIADHFAKVTTANGVEFERSRIIELKEAGWTNRRIVRYIGRIDAAIRRCGQEWVENGRFQRQDGSGRPRATAYREDRLTIRSAVTASDSSLSAIRRTTRT